VTAVTVAGGTTSGTTCTTLTYACTIVQVIVNLHASLTLPCWRHQHSSPQLSSTSEPLNLFTLSHPHYTAIQVDGHAALCTNRHACASTVTTVLSQQLCNLIDIVPYLLWVMVQDLQPRRHGTYFQLDAHVCLGVAPTGRPCG